MRKNDKKPNNVSRCSCLVEAYDLPRSSRQHLTSISRFMTRKRTRPCRLCNTQTAVGVGSCKLPYAFSIESSVLQLTKIRNDGDVLALGSAQGDYVSPTKTQIGPQPLREQ
ncbi:hypothetical protein M758_6G120900 [Ceratodon purpureus]|uniref:Uncharacterized protein n=1 Tax=Ceratodon purpureus TaxID=3225 RepID=A0A8T0HG31_CERPU|nr:hypothetical protein KC19_6G125500 [Ceratodon purpureus]KAG0613676.1 hypothetical protein M758_6G120900 [Ceratodon purpureus]